MKQTLSCLRKADEQFSLIQPGDRIAVGLSGGKDSLLLLYALWLYRRFSHKEYSLCAITVHPGYDFDPAPLHAFCQELDVPFVLHEGKLVETAVSLTKEGKAPCALCARMRRGALNQEAKAQGCNLVALGHHRDDALETFLMSLFMEARLNTLAPKSYLSRTELTVIRPLLFLNERHIRAVAKRLSLPVQRSVCPFDGHTLRETTKQLIASLSAVYPNADEMMFRALQNTDGYHLWDQYRVQSPPPSGHMRNDP